MVGSKIKRPHHSSLMPPIKSKPAQLFTSLSQSQIQTPSSTSDSVPSIIIIQKDTCSGTSPKRNVLGRFETLPHSNANKRKLAAMPASPGPRNAPTSGRKRDYSPSQVQPHGDIASVCVCVCGLISSPNLSSFNVASILDRRSPRDACLSLPRKPKQQTPATWPV